MHHNQLKSRKVYTLGETVLDIVADGGYSFQAVPGGSVLNASVSLSRMGVDVNLISEFGADKAGNLIDEFLKANAVQTGFCTRYKNHKTSIALAFLDSSKKASYSFYHDSPEKSDEILLPVFQKEDILLFGSFYSVKPNRRDLLLKVLHKAVEARSVIYYDLNIRKVHSNDFDKLMISFLDNISVATIVKGSDEDFMNLFGLSDPAAVYEKVSQHCKILILTRGSKPAQVFTPEYSRIYTVPEIEPVSTIGAGDSFNAGFIYGLVTSGISTDNIADIPVAELDRLAACGIAFATETCLSTQNYIKGNFEPDFWKKYI
ncbi:MAG: carbohydrate kinase [Lentimicrobiaceae bacterium]|jgi:fructokinase